MNSEFVVYPRLRKVAAKKIAEDVGSRPVPDLISEYKGHQSLKVDYAPTGNRITTEELKELQHHVRICASQFGYPDIESVSNTAFSEFDAKCSEILHRDMKLFPTEAAHIEVWAFMTCILLPDVVRWRYFSETTGEERFIGSNRGLRRNTFGRLWWRAYLLHQPSMTESYEFIYKLGEDELVQITERSTIAKNPILVSAASRAFLATIENNSTLNRRDLMREAAKRLQRLISLIAFEALDESEVKQIVQGAFDQTRQALVSGLK